MSFDTFKEEQQVIDHTQEFILERDRDEVVDELEELLEKYKKLFKTTRRLVRMSDRSEIGLKEANAKIQKQQMQLEKAHKQLSKYTHLLEEKVKDRTRELVVAQGKLEKLVEMGISLSLERQYAKFLEMIVQGEMELTNADGGVLFSLHDNEILKYEIIWISFDLI